MSVIRKIHAKVVDIVTFSDDVKQYTLSHNENNVRFKAGQFLHLAIEPYDPSFNWPESRVFSIANSPTRSSSFIILVSKVGKFTTMMFQQLKVGSDVWIKLPYGEFNFDDFHIHDTVLIAGGTGISPFISFLQYAIDKRIDPIINLNYGVKNTDLLIIEDLINETNKKISRFKYKIYAEDIKNYNIGLKINRGLLDIGEIIQDSLKLCDPVFYLSGPPAMILAFERELKICGIDSLRIRYDNWE